MTVPKEMVSGIDALILQFDHEWRVGSRARARDIAREYINARRLDLTIALGKYSLLELVEQIDLLRPIGRYADIMVIDMWLISEFGPQDIDGYAEVVIPVPEAFVSAFAKEEKS